MYWIALGGQNSEQLLCSTHATVHAFRELVYFCTIWFWTNFLAHRPICAYVCVAMVRYYDKSRKWMPLKTEYYFIVSSFRCLIGKTYLMVKIAENRSKNILVCENAVAWVIHSGLWAPVPPPIPASVPGWGRGEGGAVRMQGRVQGIRNQWCHKFFLNAAVAAL